MSWIEILGLGMLGGVLCGGFFYALGSFLQWLEDRDYEKGLAEAEDAWQNDPKTVALKKRLAEPFVPHQCDGDDDGA